MSCRCTPAHPTPHMSNCSATGPVRSRPVPIAAATGPADIAVTRIDVRSSTRPRFGLDLDRGRPRRRFSSLAESGRCGRGSSDPDGHRLLLVERPAVTSTQNDAFKRSDRSQRIDDSADRAALRRAQSACHLCRMCTTFEPSSLQGDLGCRCKVTSRNLSRRHQGARTRRSRSSRHTPADRRSCGSTELKRKKADLERRNGEIAALTSILGLWPDERARLPRRE